MPCLNSNATENENENENGVDGVEQASALHC